MAGKGPTTGVHFIEVSVKRKLTVLIIMNKLRTELIMNLAYPLGQHEGILNSTAAGLACDLLK